MEIKNLTTIAATGKQDNQFVGIRIINNQIEFHYPETYDLSDNDDGLRKDIIAILRTVSLAKTRSSEFSSYNLHHDERYMIPIGAYLWIINDYLTYGKYENREKRYAHGFRGKVDWKRTMRFNPIISNGNIIYTEVVSDVKSQQDNLLTEIYFFCVQRAIDSIGWLYGIGFDSNGIDYYKLYNEKRYLAAVNTELFKTFDDQKRIRLQNMKNIINGLDDGIVNTREIIYGVDSYDYVYERMIDSMFSNVDSIKDFYPSAEWDLVMMPNPVSSTNLRPDTVIVKSDKETGFQKAYILDAKYYRYGTTFIPSDMPETTSIQKQITYGEYVKVVKKDQFDRVYSSFILPYSKRNNMNKKQLNKDIEFVGIGKAKWFANEEDSEDTNRLIAAFLIDTRFLVNNWIKKNEDFIDNLISLIETHVGGITGE